LAWNGLVALDPPASPVQSREPDERVTLIPFGAAELRGTDFPVLGDAPRSRHEDIPRPLTFTFDSNDTAGWSWIGGGWWAHDGQLRTTSTGGVPGYKALAERNAVSLAFCWSHVRRRFYELAQSGPAPIATEALARIAQLYHVESDIRGRSADERRAVRQEKSRPVINALEPWLGQQLTLISQKTKLAEAIRYALSRWQGLTRFLDNGTIEIDSNVVERAIRPIALNRKNALFAGSDGGAEHWATIASLIETCKLNGVEPHTYLADVIARIVAGHPQSQIDDLLPWAYRPMPLKAVA